MPDPEIIPPPPQAKRPADFTDQIFDVICERMMEGEGLREICKSPDMPSKTTFLRWVEKDTGRQQRYQAAREALMDHYAEEIIAIAWDDSHDTIKRKNKPDLCNHEWINRSRLKVDTLKFLMSKLHPKKYGDRLPEMPGMYTPNDPITIGWETPTTIKRVILEGQGPLQERIRELEAQLAQARGEQPSGPPKLLTFDPGPLPSRMDGEIVTRLVDMIKAKVPQADQRDPMTVLEEVMSVLGEALWQKYGKDDFRPAEDGSVVRSVAPL